MTETRALANQKREFQARRFGKFGRAVLMTIASLMSVLPLCLLAADQLYHPETFVIQELQIKGKFRYLDVADVDAVLRKQELGNFFSVKLDQLRLKVEELEWVQSANVRRKWPNSLRISVVEHQPAMRWGDDKWVSTSGVIIKLPSTVTARKVVALEGDDAQSEQILLQAVRWLNAFKNDGIELRKVTLSSSQAWTLVLYCADLNSEFDLLLGSDDIAERLARFKVLFKEQLKRSEYRLKRVDARYPDGLAVKHGQKKNLLDVGFQFSLYLSL